jgi:hypothetical protein
MKIYRNIDGKGISKNLLTNRLEKLHGYTLLHVPHRLLATLLVKTMYLLFMPSSH